MADTVYKIKLEYGLNDKASSALAHLAAKTDRVAKNMTKATTSAGFLTRALHSGQTVGLSRIGLIATAIWGMKEAFDAAWSIAVEYNKQIEQMKIGLSAVINLNLGGSFADASQMADKLFTNYQKRAITSTATTKDFIEMNNRIAPAILQAGLNMRDLEEFKLRNN